MSDMILANGFQQTHRCECGLWGALFVIADTPILVWAEKKPEIIPLGLLQTLPRGRGDIREAVKPVTS